MMETRIPNSENEKGSETEPSESTPFNWRLFIHSTAWRPPADVYETEESVFVRVEVAGMREEDFSIELNGRELLIRGTRQDTAERRAFHQMEIRFGEFAFTLELPHQIEPEGVQAVYKEGFLLITLPMARPHQILIGE